MAVVKSIQYDHLLKDQQEEPLEVEIVDDDQQETPESTQAVTHDGNLAEYIDDDELSSLASELVQAYEADDLTRKDWRDVYLAGLELLGMKVEERTVPWDGACGVFHPLLTEAVIRFQAQTITSIFPASGPVKTKIVGKHDTERSKQAGRVEHEMNYQLTDNMTEYRKEKEQLLFRLALAGSAFKKVYYDPERGRPVAMFVPAEDFVIQYGASDLETCPRYTHVMKRTPNEIKKLQVSGFYRDISLPPPAPEYTEIKEKHDEIEGTKATIEDDDRHTILEMHVDIDLPGEYADPDGIARPYIVTIDKHSRKVLSIYCNYDKDDEKKRKKEYFVHYLYIPGFGFYGLGLIHLIGGLAKSATSILRQLVDAGTLANLPGGLKAKTFRVKGDDTPIGPGEWRDVDIGGGSIRDSLFPLPYKEPSGVLYQLLTNVVEEGRRIGSIADLQIGNMSQEAPVGTTLALLERNLKVMSAVQGRIHYALAKELKLISSVIRDFMPENYDYEVDGNYKRAEDFDGRVDVIPVSDPNASTMAQKVVQYQAALQLSQQAPQIYNIALLHRQMVETLGIPNADKVVPMPGEMHPVDPITENMAILKQEPVKAFYYQDHDAHIKIHMAAAQDPKLRELVGQSPFAQAIESAMAAHITEHIAYQYRTEVERNLGVSLPDPEAPLPQDVEFELSKAVADAAAKVLQKNTAEQAKADLEKEKNDPLNQLQHRELMIKEKEVDYKIKMAEQNSELEQAKKFIDAMLKKQQIESDERKTGAELGVKIASDKLADDTAQTKAAIDAAVQITTAQIQSKAKSNGSSE